MKSANSTLTRAGGKKLGGTGSGELDKSFDRKALVDKISQRVEYIYLPSYQNMRRMIFKAMKLMGSPSKK